LELESELETERQRAVRGTKFCPGSSSFESWLLKAKELLLRAREQLFLFFLGVWRMISRSGEMILHPEC